MPSKQYQLVSSMMRLIRLNKLLDMQGGAFDKLLKICAKQQKKELRIPRGKMPDFEIGTKLIDGTLCYIIKKKDSDPQKAVLYLFGGGYIFPPDPGDIILCGQIAENCNAEVWFPLYPLAPEHRLAETMRATLNVYLDILKNYPPESVRFFGTSSGGAQAFSLCIYIRHEKIDSPLPGKLVLQSPGLQVPPSDWQRQEMERRKSADVMIPPGFFDRIAPVLATGDEAYLLSPVLYDLTGFPQMDVFYGIREVMIAYLPDLKAACRRYGVPLKVHIGRGMVHCWGAMEFVPEAKEVRREYFEALR